MKKIKHAIKKEILIYLVMLFVLSMISHSDFLSNPFVRFQMMYEKGNYFHPLIYTFVIYSVIFIIRKVLDFVIGLFEKKPN